MTENIRHGELYETICHVKASIGERPITIGNAQACRYCGSTDQNAFRNRSHTMPEALGNKWITSSDECDACNQFFGRYDDALAKSVAPILTVGGTRGRNNKVRQTGRTDGHAVIRHRTEDGERFLSMEVRDLPFEQYIAPDPLTGTIHVRVPVASDRFVPLHAYKAIAKMGVALLPDSELRHFMKLREWLRSEGNPDGLGGLVVSIAFGSVGNAPPLASGLLLRRKVEDSRFPYIAFVTSVGSVCLQIDLKSDSKDGVWPPGERARIALRYENVLAPPGKPELRIDYGDPVLVDWSEDKLMDSMLEALNIVVNIHSSEAAITPIFRAEQLDGSTGMVVA